MRIHIVNPYGSKAMVRMIEPLRELAKLYELTESETVEPQADLNIHVPWHTLADDMDYGAGKHIAVYTHCNPGAEALLIKACERADIVTAMSFTGRQELLNFGVDPKKIWVVYSAADGFVYRPRTILVVSYPQPNGRKRESLLTDLAWQYDLTPYQFILAGNHWEETAERLKMLGVNVQYTEANNDELVQKLYQMTDVFIATGYMEGGPLPLLEAMASGVRVLSPRFGYAADLLDEDDLYETPAELMEKLDAYNEKSVRYHQLARLWTWTDYAAEYAMLIGRLFNSTADLYPERGMSRYVQLLDIIDRERPQSICEIGTWNGHRAIQMLQTAAKYRPMKRISYQGFDLFEGQTGEQFTHELSKYGCPQKVVEKRLEATGAKIELVAGDTFETIDLMKTYDFYFIDGGHSEDTIDNDGSRVTSYIDEYGGVAVFDDYYHSGKPDGVGCNKFINELNREVFEVTHLPAHTHASDGREIGMVQVKHADIRLQGQKETYSSAGTLDDGEPYRVVSTVWLGHAPGSTDADGELERTAPA
jgi:hypothetical protein